MNEFDWGTVWYAIPYMLMGTWVTLEICVLSILFGTLVGVLCGLLSLSGVKPVQWLVRAYVYFVRGTPALVQVFLIYFALPQVGIYISAFWCGVIALSFNAGAFIAEIVRASVESIDAGQTEAAMAIGMTHRQSLLHILLPQSLRRMTPPLTNELITLVKGSSRLSVSSITERTRSGQVIIAERSTPSEIYAVLAVFYLVLISILSQLSEYVEKRLA